MNPHPSEQELVLYFYGDAARPAALERHLSECAACSVEFAQLRSTLTNIDYPVPDRSADYEAQLWSTIAPRLESEQAPEASIWANFLQPRRWAVAGAVAALIVTAFLAGRYTPHQPPTPVQTVAVQPPKSGSGNDRVLMVAVGDHLDRTEMILVELANTPAEGKVDISAERDLAQALVSENRLYRQTAQHDKDPEIAGVLDQVERVLIDIAHHPDSVSAKELAALQERIQSQGVLFKVRVVESKVKARSRASQKTGQGRQL
jgi:hypothetical protein